jgi:hypothetical protein
VLRGIVISSRSPALIRQLENTGSTIFQTLAGILLDNNIPGRKSKLPKQNDAVAIQHLLYAFLFFNVLQLVSLRGLAYLDKCRRGRERDPYCPEDLFSTPGSDSNASMHDHPETSPVVERMPLLSHSGSITWDPADNVYRRSEKRRGHLYAGLSAFLIFAAWVLFLGTAWLRLRSTKERGVRES